MSLFVGNLSSNVRFSELKDTFTEMGKCQIEKKVSEFINLISPSDGHFSLLRERQQSNFPAMQPTIVSK